MSTAIVYYSMLGNSEMIVYHIIYHIVKNRVRSSVRFKTDIYFFLSGTINIMLDIINITPSIIVNIEYRLSNAGV